MGLLSACEHSVDGAGAVGRSTSTLGEVALTYTIGAGRDAGIGRRTGLKNQRRLPLGEQFGAVAGFLIPWIPWMALETPRACYPYVTEDGFSQSRFLLKAFGPPQTFGGYLCQKKHDNSKGLRESHDHINA